MIESISAITLATHNMSRAVNFYRRLGFETVHGGDDAFLDGRRERIAALGLRHALPTMSLTREAAAAGSLMSYGSDRLDVYRARAQQAHRCAMLCPTISLDSRAPLLRAWRCRCVTTTSP